MRRVEVRAASRAFIDSVRSVRMRSVSFGIEVSPSASAFSACAVPLQDRGCETSLSPFARERYPPPHAAGHSGAVAGNRRASFRSFPSFIRTAQFRIRAVRAPSRAPAQRHSHWRGARSALGNASIERIVAPALGGLVIGYAVAQALSVPMIFTERKHGQMVLRRGFTIGEARRCAVIEDVVTTGSRPEKPLALSKRQAARSSHTDRF